MLTTNPQRTMATSYNPILIPPETSHNVQMYHLRLFIFFNTHFVKGQTNSLYKSVYRLNQTLFSTTSLRYAVVFQQNVNLPRICGFVAFSNLSYHN
jgi:hypothetical protein